MLALKRPRQPGDRLGAHKFGLQVDERRMNNEK